MIQERLAEGAEEKNDLFSNLLKSNSEDAGPNALTERELAGELDKCSDQTTKPLTVNCRKHLHFFDRWT